MTRRARALSATASKRRGFAARREHVLSARGVFHDVDGSGAPAGRLALFALALATALVLILSPAATAMPGVYKFWGNTGLTQTLGGTFDQDGPQGIAVNQATGDVYVADRGNNRVQQFDSNGTFIRAWGFDVTLPAASPASTATFEVCTVKEDCKAGTTGAVGGTNPGGQLRNPAGIAIEQATGNVYVSDVTFNRIQVFSPTGAFLRAFGQDVIRNGQPNDNGTGYEICDVSAGNVAADCKAGAAGTAGGALSSPGYLTIAPAGAPNAGNVLVADQLRSRVQEFTSGGAFVRAFGGGVLADNGAEGTGTVTNGSATVTAVATTKKAFLPGQEVAGTGIAPGTTVVSVAATTLTLSQPAGPDATGAGTVLTVAEAPGSVPVNEKQIVTLNPDVVSGNFKLRFTAPNPQSVTVVQTTANIPFNASAAEVQDALAALTNVGLGNVVVTSSNPGGGADPGGPYTVEFTGARYSDTNVAQLVRADGTPNLNVSGSAGATISTSREGASSFDVCEVAARCLAGAPGSGDGQFSAGEPKRIAEDSAGNIYTVEETGSFRVQKFTLPGNVVTPHGTYLCSELCGTHFDGGLLGSKDVPSEVAVDYAGFVYVVKAFEVGTGDPPVELTNLEQAPWQQRLLKVDPAANGGAGEVVCTMLVNPGEGPVEGGSIQKSSVIKVVAGLAAPVDEPSTGDADCLGSPLYISTRAGEQGGSPSRVYKLAELPGLAATALPAIDVSASSAVLRGTVDPADTPFPVTTSYRFEYSRDGGANWLAASDTEVNVGNGAAGGESSTCPSPSAALCHVSQVVDGLELDRTYQFRLVASSSFRGATVASAPREFTTDATPPAATTGTAVWSGPPSTNPSLIFTGRVNPGGDRTVFSFQYVSEAQFAASGFHGAASAPIAPRDVGNGVLGLDVTAVAAGLDPTSPYRFRIVASNSSGTTLGETRVAAPSRAGDRFNELVSAGDSQGTSLGRQRLTISDDGERAQFEAIAFGDQPSSPFITNPNISLRGRDGWSAVQLGPDPDRFVGIQGFGDAALSKRLWPGQSIAEKNQGKGRWTFRHLDGSLTHASPPLTPLDRVGSLEGYQFEGGSTDLSTFVFSGPQARDSISLSGATYFTGEPLILGTAARYSNLYLVQDADTNAPALDVLNRGTDGKVIGGACGARLGAESGPSALDGGDVPMEGAVSADGSIAYFSARPSAAATGNCNIAAPIRLFKRIGGASTVAVSASQCDRIAPECAPFGTGTLTAGSKVITDVVTESGSFPEGATGSGDRSSGSPTITNLTAATGAFKVGMLIAGPGIPSGATIESVDAGAGTLTLSANATSTGAGGALEAGFPIRADIGVPFGAFIVRVLSPTELELNAAATASRPGIGLNNSGDFYWDASADGSKVYFSTARQLVDSDLDTGALECSTFSSAGCDLYLYDSSPPDGEPSLVQVSAGEVVPGDHPTIGSGANVLGVVDVSRDGSRVYFVAQGVLTATANPAGATATAGASNLYVYERDADDSDGRIAFVATLLGGSDALGGLDAKLWGRVALAADKGKPAYALPFYDGLGEGRSDGDGHVLLFLSQAQLQPGDADSVEDLYRYDDEAGKLECLSCVGDGPQSVRLFGRQIDDSSADAVQFLRVASENASAVVFTTAESLLPGEDTNAVQDAYLWRDGQLDLVSASTGDVGVIAGGGGANALGGPAISPDGRSVFFQTAASILPQDTDNGALDFYVARVDGGFPQAAGASDPCDTVPAACESQVEGPAPTPTPIGSATFAGAGNVEPKRAKPRRCPNGKRRVKAKRGKTRCIVKRRNARGKHRKANTERRAGR